MKPFIVSISGQSVTNVMGWRILYRGHALSRCQILIRTFAGPMVALLPADAAHHQRSVLCCKGCESIS